MLLSDRPFAWNHLTSVDELPCDDVLLDEAETAARTSLQSVGSLPPRTRSRPGTVSAWSSASAPSLDGTFDWSPTSRDGLSSPGSRPGSRSSASTGRFFPEELACFRRIPTPSSISGTKMEIYMDVSNGMMKRPGSKSKFFRKGPSQDQPLMTTQSARREADRQNAEVLPEEALTAKVLNEIYPRSVSDPGLLHTHSAEQSPRRATLREEEPKLYRMLRGSIKNVATMTKVTDTMKPSKGDTLKPTILTQQLTPHKSHKSETSTPSAYKSRQALGTTPVPGSPLSTGNFNNTSNFNSTLSGGQSGNEMKINPHASRIEMMLQFRELIIERGADVPEVLNIFQSEIPLGAHEMLTQAEWRRGLARLGLELCKEERVALFKQIDTDSDGRISVVEVQINIEAAAPVKTLTDLRRRWLASGLNSMNAALHTIEESGFKIQNRLSLREFGEALMRVSVFDHSEHLALFNIILDPSDPLTKVSIGDLMCAVATVSPSLLLEEIRDRLLRRHHGQIEKVYSYMDSDHSGGLEHKEFVDKCCRFMDMREAEAEKAFRMIDVDSSGCITQPEFISALAMSEPSLFLEDLRQKVRQRFRSIQKIFAKVKADNVLLDDEQEPKFTLERFQEILGELHMSNTDTRILFELIDTDLNGTLTFPDFLKATRQLAPSCAFENLRLHCLSRNRQISESFAAATTKRGAPMTFTSFSEMLHDLQLAEDVNIKVIFDVLDIKHDGVVTMSRLIAALQAGGPGRNARLTKEEQKYKAEMEARSCTSTIRKLAGDLKTQVRLGTRGQDRSPDSSRMRLQRSDEEAEDGADSEGQNTMHRPASPEKNSPPKMKRSWGAKSLFGVSNRGAKILAQLHGAQKKEMDARRKGASAERADADESGSPSLGQSSPVDSDGHLRKSANPAHGPPRLRAVPDHELKAYQVPLVAPKRGGAKAKAKAKSKSEILTKDNQQSWSYIWRRLHETTGTDDREDIEKKVHNYYQTATWRLSHDGALLEQSPSRHLMHQNMRAHQSALL